MSAASPVDPWQEEPVRGGYPHPAFAALSGAERNERFLEFSIPPPIAFLVGTRPEWVATAGESLATMPANGWWRSPQGRMPLGALAIVTDLAFGFAAGSMLPPGGGFTTAELSMTRLATPSLDGDIVARGRLIHVAGPMGFVEATVTDGEGRMVAHGTSRLAMFPPPGELPPVPDPPPRPQVPDYGSPAPFERPPLGEVLDPSVWASLSGLEVLQRQAKGDLPVPPIGRLTGMRVTDAEEGRATVVLPASEWLATPAGTVQGGVTAMLADAALQCAVQTTVEAGHGFAPLDVKVNYLRPVLPDGGLLTGVGEVTHRGRSLAVAHAVLTDASGRKVAVATGSAALDGAALL